MGTFKCRQNSLGPRELYDCIQCRCVVLRYILCASGIVQSRMLGANGGVVEACRDGMRSRDLSILILQNVGIGALQDSRLAAAKTRCMLAQFGAAAASLDADQPNLLLWNEFVKRA